MADKNASETKNDNNGQSDEDQKTMKRLPLLVRTQYIKDLSFENPRAPETFQGGKEAPKMDINFSMNARDVEGIKDTFEVTLGVEARAMRGDDVVFLIELQYAGVVSLENVPEGRKHPMLLIQVPQYLFPFARQIVADMTQQAGYMPLLLNPVNFRQMYMERFGLKQGEQGNGNTEEGQNSAQAAEA